jgi:threonine dehydrogenase-like Zn-dependent dehydrogenase
MGSEGSPSSPIGTHRVVQPAGALPQSALRLDSDPAIHPDEVRIDVDRLNLDAASFRQLREAHGGDVAAIKAAVLEIITTRGKMHNPVTGSGGMLLGTVSEVGPDSPLGLRVGDRVATLVSLTLTPLAVTDGLAHWDGRSEQVPCTGHAIVFARSIVAKMPSDLPEELALAVLDVCGAPALVTRVVTSAASAPNVLVLGAGGKSGSLSLAAARAAGAASVTALVPTDVEGQQVAAAGLADRIVVADARDPVAASEAVGDPADITVVCVDVPGCEGAAVLSTAPGGTVIFFSMATSVPAAALAAEGVAADLTLLIGNGYVPGHADLALGLVRHDARLRSLLISRLDLDSRVMA